MYFRGIIAAGAIAAGFAAPPPPAAGGPARPAVVNLHAEFARLAGHVTRGPIAGVVPALGTRASAKAAAGCTEPGCPLAYHGGSVQHAPRVYLVIWGNWSSQAASTAESYLAGLYQGLGAAPHNTWSALTAQYVSPGGAESLAGYVNDTSTPPNPVTAGDLGAEAAAYAAYFGITDLTNAQVVVASAPGTCFADGFAGTCGTPSYTGGYCAWHSSVSIPAGSLPFTNLPFQLDAGYGCGENWINQGYFGEFDGFTTVAGHEYAESVTDPFPGSGWDDTADTASGGEIADKCAWGGAPFGDTDPAGNVTLPTGTFAMQSLWSNAARACALTTAPALTVTTPDPQRSLLGADSALRITAATNDGYPLTYRAGGLPPSLSIDPSGGVITGTATTTAGTWHPVIAVTAGPLTRKVTFGWQVSSPPGPVKGYAGKCVDDSGGRTSSGNKIDLWACTGKAPQRITFAANGQLQVAGGCVTGGRRAFLEPCTSAANKTWTRRPSGEYTVASTGLCLTAPTAKNGVQLTLATCKNSSTQHWSLPLLIRNGRG